MRSGHSAFSTTRRSDFSAEDRANPVDLAALIVDAMELRFAHRRRVEQAQNFRQIANAIPGMIWTTRPEGGCDYVNKTW
jgi:PAS domain-containing protein